jgi:hypothetical protein
MGRFTLRLPESLHHELEIQAQQEGVSLNQYIVYALARQAASRYTIQVLPPEIVEQQRTRFDQLLEHLGPPSIAVTEAFLAERELAEPESDLTDEIITRIEAKIARKKAKG